MGAWDCSRVLTCLVRPEEGQPGGLEGAPDCHLLRRRRSSRALAEAPEADPVAAAHRQLLPAVRPPGQRAHLCPVNASQISHGFMTELLGGYV